jgi:hypothetical protein
VDVETCRTSSSPSRANQISLTFAPDGSVATARVTFGPIVGRPEAQCVEQLFSTVHTGEFAADGRVTGTADFRLVPAKLPEWLKAFERKPELPAPKSAPPVTTSPPEWLKQFEAKRTPERPTSEIPMTIPMPVPWPPTTSAPTIELGR